MNNPWSDESVALLTKLWTDGLSASTIARQMGDGISRGAVIGKSRRLALPARRVGNFIERSLPAPLPRTKAPAFQQRYSALTKSACLPRGAILKEAPAVPAITRMIAFPPRARRNITIMDLTDTTCKWPIGDPLTPDFRYCGAIKSILKSPYCPDCHAIAYVPRAARMMRNAGSVAA